MAAKFNESHLRRLLVNARYADRLLSDIEGILNAGESKSPFPQYRPDVTLHQAKQIRNHLARFRDHLSRVLTAAGVPRQDARFGSIHSIRVNLAFVRVAVQEMGPQYLRGYGEMSPEAEAELRGLSNELEGLIDSLERNLALGDAVDLEARLQRLQQTSDEAGLLRLLDRIIGDNELAEYRAPLLTLVERLESPRFEIAVFGRVSSGKSSLLNHLLGTTVLPVGVNPITAVPTRIQYGPEPSLTVTLVDRKVLRHPLEDLVQYASEEQNPGNERGVVRLDVALPSPRLKDGLVLVDTPGFGALATAGAAETLSYLPQCDLGILLISAVNPVNEEDLSTMQALAQAAIPQMVLLSKADLLNPADRGKAEEYSRKAILENLGLKAGVHPVSTVAEHEALLEDWFREELEPMFARQRELAQASIRRKAGALRESVALALRTKLGGAEGAEPASGVPLEEIERGLRTAASEIEQTRRACLAQADEVRSLAGQALREAAAARPATQAVVREMAETAAAEAATRVAGRLRQLARTLESALAAAAEALRDNGGMPGVSLEECVRGLPRFDVSLSELEVRPPWFLPVPALARQWVVAKLDREFGALLGSAFATLSRALELWAAGVQAELQRRFDERADLFRAQLERRMSHKELQPEDRARLKADLEQLENWPADKAGG